MRKLIRSFLYILLFAVLGGYVISRHLFAAADPVAEQLTDFNTTKMFAVQLQKRMAAIDVELKARRVQLVSSNVKAAPSKLLLDTPKLGGFTIPSSSVESQGDVGLRAHTNFLLSNRGANLVASGVRGLSDGTLPSQLRQIYGISEDANGAGAIAIVDAYDFPTALADFNIYSAAAHLPQEHSNNPIAAENPVFQLVYADTQQPEFDYNWSGEEALDIEIAHAIAPHAKIYLVEAKDNSNDSLFHAVQVAATLPNVKEISMSWSSSEFAGQAQFDAQSLSAKGIIYLAATGDSGASLGGAFPAASPNVIAVGGTSLHFDTTGKLCTETAWSGSGGGASTFENIPPFQVGVSNVTGRARGFPDVSAEADPDTGIAVLQNGEWSVIGGTSLACPLIAAIINDANPKIIDTQDELKRMYNNAAKFEDIIRGNNGYATSPGYDFVTGLGVPNGLGGF